MLVHYTDRKILSLQHLLSYRQSDGLFGVSAHLVVDLNKERVVDGRVQ